MSLNKVKLATVVKKQFQYKLKAYIDSFISLVLLQLLALLFSVNGTGSSGIGRGDIQLSITYYSADIVVIFMLLWGFISALLLTTKAYRFDDFLYITNRLSSHLANGLFLLTASFFAGVTAILSSFLVKAFVLLFSNELVYPGGFSLSVAPKEVFIGIVATSFYIFLFCIVGYFVGTLIQLNRILIVIIPVLFFGELILSHESMVISFFTHIFTEASLLIFMAKIMATTALLFIASIAMSNRMEVR